MSAPSARSFNYVAVNDMGRTIRGVITAENEMDVEARLKQNGLELVTVKPVRERKAGFLSRVKNKDLIVLCMHLEQLNRAGVPLHESLNDIRDSTDSPKLRDTLTSISESIKSGAMLSKALGEHPKTFNKVFIGLVAAGEKTGNLADSFHHLAEHMKWVANIRRKIKKAIRYPIALVLVISIVISILMIFVVPKLIDFILAQGFSVPLHTRALIAFSHAFQDYWYLIFGIPIGLIILLTILYRKSDSFAYRLDSILLGMPIFGPVIRKIDMARFTHFFAVMFNSGIDILECLQGAREVVKNRVLKESVLFVENSVTDGNSLTASLRLSNQFPSLVIRMFKVGEDSGNMREALHHINFFYDQEVNDAVDSMVGLIQPTLTVVMGLMIFWIVAAVFGPLYESFSKMKF